MALGSDTYKNASLNACYGTSHHSSWPSTIYVALHTSVPTPTNEVHGGGYARIAVANNDTNWPLAVAGIKTSGAEFAFTTSTGAWIGIGSYFGFWDGLTGGLLVEYAVLAAQISVPAAGVTASFAAGDLSITAG